ncbi:MAG: metal ABC transporter permease [Leptolyngbyaceae cyanobacterium]
MRVDTAIARTFSSFSALGITLLTTLNSHLDLEELLFSDILGMTIADVWQIGLITIVILAAVKFFYKELLFFTFDRLEAKASDLPITLGPMAVLTLAIVAGIKTVEVILVMAVTISPAPAVSLLATELH